MDKNNIGCYCLNNSSDDFIKWLVQLLGPVLLGVKPAEILSFPKNNQEGLNKMEIIKQVFQYCSKVGYKEVTISNRCTKLFFYHKASLNQALSDSRNLKFLRQLGYANNYDMEDYLNLLLNKVHSGEIPDEIGLFLGYPLKDVIGFIGHSSLKLTKIKGWRVYGDPRLSDEKYHSFMMAKNHVKKMLEYSTPIYIVQSA
ncbi:DUF3793 family protein [Anaerosolibacter sp.]|uniref:DUF3793 family protein n=1 Tax=Anaerosolibacter sp. TaxID=1872527 RepID=UPI0039EE3A01